VLRVLEQAHVDKPQALSQLANTLFGISLLLVLFGVVHYAVHLPVFPLHAVQLVAAPQRVDAAQIEDIVRNELRGNFFTVDLEGTRKAFEKLPWVRKVNVRRHFPWQLDVELEEHVALASWNGAELVNTHGEVFAAESEQVLPKFIGEADTAAEVTKMYQAFRRAACTAQAEGGANQSVPAPRLAVTPGERHGAGTGARAGSGASGALRGGLSV